MNYSILTSKICYHFQFSLLYWISNAGDGHGLLDSSEYFDSSCTCSRCPSSYYIYFARCHYSIHKALWGDNFQRRDLGISFMGPHLIWKLCYCYVFWLKIVKARSGFSCAISVSSPRASTINFISGYLLNHNINHVLYCCKSSLSHKFIGTSSTQGPKFHIVSSIHTHLTLQTVF